MFCTLTEKEFQILKYIYIYITFSSKCGFYFFPSERTAAFHNFLMCCQQLEAMQHLCFSEIPEVQIILQQKALIAVQVKSSIAINTCLC